MAFSRYLAASAAEASCAWLSNVRLPGRRSRRGNGRPRWRIVSMSRVRSPACGPPAARSRAAVRRLAVGTGFSPAGVDLADQRRPGPGFPSSTPTKLPRCWSCWKPALA